MDLQRIEHRERVSEASSRVWRASVRQPIDLVALLRWFACVSEASL
jgi:hypothetical protein